MFSRRRFLAASVASSLTAPLAKALGHPPLIASTMIDSHVHVWTHNPKFPFAEGAHPPAEDASVEMLLKLMKANRVARTVIIQVIHYRWDNSYLANVLRRYPRIFKGVCRVDPKNSDAPDHLSRLTEIQGFHGVRLSPSAGPDGDWIRSPLMFPLWQRCALLKVPMTLLLPAIRIPDIEPLIQMNPELQVVIDHMADISPTYPKDLDLLLSLARFPNVFVKLSHLWSLSRDSYPYADMAGQVKSLHASFGARRLMWGTDWPISLKQVSYSQAVDLFRNHLEYLPLHDREQILYKTVQEVWPFGL